MGNVVSSKNLTKLVVAVAVVLGSEIVEVLVMQNFFTHGTRESRPAKHGHSPRQSSSNIQMLLKKKGLT